MAGETGDYTVPRIEVLAELRGDRVLVGLNRQRLPSVCFFASFDSSRIPPTCSSNVWRCGSRTFEELDVADGHFRDAGVLAIATSRNVSALRKLDMDRQYDENASVSAATLAALFSSRQLPALRELVVFGTSFAGAFVRSSLRLRSLTIDTATFTNADAAELSGAKSLAKLEHLEIRGPRTTRFKVDKPALAAIASRLKRLESFRMRGVEIRL